MGHEAATPPHVLILGGTTEAVALAHLLTERPWRVTTSLAGRTVPRRLPPGNVRSGGFGGADGLAAFLTQQNVAAVVDATHPFAARISANARLACDSLNLPRLRLERPQWTAQPGDRWITADSPAAAAALLPGLARHVFLTLGTTDLSPFAALSNLRFTLRLIEPPPTPPFPGCAVVAGRGPFDVETETALFRAHGFEALVGKASGGTATVAKLTAARRLGLPVVMIRRPPAEPGPNVAAAEPAREWLDRRLRRPDNPSSVFFPDA